MRSPFKAIFYFCIFCAILVAGLFAYKGINPFNLSLNVFNLKPIFSEEKSESKTGTASTIPKPNFSQEIVLTELDIQNLITASAAEYIESPTVKINQNDILVSGDVIKVIKTHADITLKMKFSNGKVTVDISDLKTGALGAPNWLKGTISDLINKELDKNLNKKYKVKGITQQIGKIIIEV